MGRVIAVANQKGGVAKTTTVHTLGSALAELGERVLLIDLDPQACLTYSLGFDPELVAESIHDVLTDAAKIGDVILSEGPLDLVPASIDLAATEAHLLTRTGREQVLRGALDQIRDSYDSIIIDCAPSLGVLTVNALTAADAVIIPLQCETLGHRGVGQLLHTVAEVQEFTNPRLIVRGVIATMYDGRFRHHRDVLADIPGRYGVEVIEPPVPKSVRFAEAPARGLSILTYAPRSAGARAYRSIAATLHAD